MRNSLDRNHSHLTNSFRNGPPDRRNFATPVDVTDTKTAPELIDTQGASFLDDESEVMGQMLNRAVDHLVHGAIAAIANDSRPLPRFRW